jgi:hypothetical protein
MSASGGHFERPLDVLLAHDVGKVGSAIKIRFGGAGSGREPLDRHRTEQMRGEARQ